MLSRIIDHRSATSRSSGDSRIAVIQTLASLRQCAGGPPRTVIALCRELAKLGIEVDVIRLSPKSDQEAEVPFPLNDLVRGFLAYPPPFLDVPVLAAFGFYKIVQARCQRWEKVVVHDHGIWLPTNHASAVAARRSRVCRIVSPRGMLEPWAINYRAWKKRIAWVGYQQKDLATADVVHATCDKEAENLRRCGVTQPIAIIPNGVDLPSLSSKGGCTPRPYVVLFLGRLHPVKGLLNLVDAWRLARPRGWQVIIAGPDESGYQAVVKERIRSAGLDDEFQFVGQVEGAKKEGLYRRASLFVLPSFSENFGVAIAEALAFGVPSIATKGAPWAGLNAHNCGWWIEPGVKSLEKALREATNLSTEKLAEMGQRGQRYVEEAFSWEGVALRMGAVYRWMLDEADMPDCVHRE